MPKQNYALEEGKQKRLGLKWGFGFKDFQVTLDGQPVGGAPSLQKEPAGVDVPLPTGQTLHARLQKGFPGPELTLLLDGEPVPGAPNDPAQRVKVAAGITFFVGGLTTVLGLVSVAMGSRALDAVGIGLESLFMGVVFLTLGVFIRKGVGGALWAAMILLALDAVASVVLIADAGGRPPVGAIVVRVFFLGYMAKALPAMKELKLRRIKLSKSAEGGGSGAPVGVSVAPKDEG